MTSSAELRRLVAGLLVTLFGAPLALAATEPSFAPRLTHEIARRWAVEERDVVLDWSRTGDAATLPADALTRLDGTARDGWLTLLVTPASGPSRAVPLRAGVRRTVAVAAHDLAAGTRLTAADLRLDVVTCWGMPSRDAGETVAPGWEIRRPIAAGEALTRPAVAPPPLVFAGGPVTLEWVQNGVRVTINGVALHAARAHETVRVRLDDGHTVRDARVTGPGAAALMEDPR